MSSKSYLVTFLGLSLIWGLVSNPACGAQRRRGGGGGGGVFLTTPNPTNPVEHNNRGVELGQKGIWPDAIREHEKALEMDPHNQRWRTNLSAAHLGFGRFLKGKNKNEAMNEFRRAMIIDPANAQADQELDSVIASLGKNPMDYDYRFSTAEKAANARQFDTAMVEMRKCVDIRKDALSYARLGRIYKEAGKIVDGYKMLVKAVGMQWPDDNESRNQLASCHRELGDILRDFALKAKDTGKGTKGMQRLYNAGIEYRRAVTINPGDAAAIEGLLAVSQMALAIRPSFENHMFMAAAYVLAGKFANAQMEYNECYKLKPNRPELSTARIAYHQAVARHAMSSPEQIADSVTKIKKLIDEDPQNARLYYILGRLREHQSEYPLAKKCYDRAKEINPLIDPDLAVAYVRIGAASSAPASTSQAPQKTPEQSKEALQKQMKEQEIVELEGLIEKGELDKAIDKGQEMFRNKENEKEGRIPGAIGRAYQKKALSEPAKATEHNNSAKVWYRIGAGLNDASSRRFLEQIDADRVIEKMKEADELFKAGKYIDAKTLYQDVVEILPKRADAHRRIGECLEKLGDKEGARKEFNDADRLDRGLPIEKSEPEPAKPEAKSESKPAEAKAEEGLKLDTLQMAPVKKKK